VSEIPSHKTRLPGAILRARPAADQRAVVLALGCGCGQRLLCVSEMVVEWPSTAVPFPLEAMALMSTVSLPGLNRPVVVSLWCQLHVFGGVAVGSGSNTASQGASYTAEPSVRRPPTRWEAVRSIRVPHSVVARPVGLQVVVPCKVTWPRRPMVALTSLTATSKTGYPLASSNRMKTAEPDSGPFGASGMPDTRK
jgi:hypothetical protein